MIRNLPVHPVPESNPSKSSEESGFEIALAQPKIANTSLEELKQALRYVFVLIGLRAKDIPVAEEKAVLMDYIRENYGGHTPEEIKLAFKMAIQGRLALDYEKQVVSFGNFSPMYFTIIMDAYRVWAREQVEILARKVPEKKLSPRENLNINIDYAAYLFNQINKLPAKIGTSSRNSKSPN